MTLALKQSLAASLFILIPFMSVDAAPVVRDFESTRMEWTASAEGIAVDSDRSGAQPDGGSKAMRVKGTSPATGEIALDDAAIPMSSRQFYRMTAWIRIGKSNPQPRPPSVVCLFEAEAEESRLGRAELQSYDTSRPGVWQKLEGEFRVPYGTVRGCLAVVSPSAGNGQKSQKSIDISIAVIALEQIDHYTIDNRYRFDPLPSGLEAVRGVHPRLYLTKKRVAELKKAITTTHKRLFDEFIAQTSRMAAGEPPKYMDKDSFSNTEQLYMRGVGDAMPFFALAFLLTDETKYLDSAKKWALAACSYPTWGLDEFANSDLSTGHQLHGLAVVYDWLYDDLDEAARRTIRETLESKGARLFDAAAKGIIVPDDEAYKKHPWPEWDEAWLQNHLWINSCGLAAAGLAIFDEVPDGTRWAAFTLDRYRRTMAVLGNDGASHEGPGYWSYGVDWMLRFMDISRYLLGEDMYTSEWWRNTWRYRLAMSLPQNSWTISNTTVDVGDSRRFDWYGPDYMLRKLAGEYKNGRAQWLADALDSVNAEHPVDRWLNILWYDPSVKSVPPGDLPTLFRFEDMDIATMRSDWSGNESFVFFKCGPYIGHSAIETMTYCPSSAHHVHPDTGNFMVFAEGEWLIRDDGYRAKYTGQHNTLLADGGEQLGGGYPIFNGVEAHGAQARPNIIRAESTPSLDHIAGDATEAYPKSSGLTKFVRHLIYLKPDVLIVLDDIACDGERDLELRFHPEQPEAVQDGAAFVTTGKLAVMRLEALTTADVAVNAETLMAKPKEDDGKDEPLNTVRLRKHTGAWHNATALSWTKTDGKPVRVTLNESGSTWTFTAGERRVEFDWTTGEAKLAR